MPIAPCPEYPLCIYYPPASHLIAFPALKLSVLTLQCMPSSNPSLLNTDPEVQTFITV